MSSEDVTQLIAQTAECIVQLKKMGVIQRTDDIPLAYAKWFCAHHLSLELVASSPQVGYDARSKYGDRVQIKKQLRSDTNFEATFGDVCLNCIDYLFIVFMDEKTWEIVSIYQVSRDILIRFVNNEQTTFQWCGELRSLSLQVYPWDDNTLLL